MAIGKTTEVVEVKGDTAQYIKSLEKAQKGNKSFRKSVKSSGKSMMYLNQSIEVGQKAFSGLATVYSGIMKTAKDYDKFNQLLARTGTNGEAVMLQLEGATSGLIDRISLLRYQAILMNGELQLSSKQTEGVLKHAIEFSRKSGEDIDTVLDKIREGIAGGTESVLEDVGLYLETVGTPAQKATQIVEKLVNTYKDHNIVVETGAEKQKVLKNRLQAANIEIGKQTKSWQTYVNKGLNFVISGYVKLAKIMKGTLKDADKESLDTIVKGIEKYKSIGIQRQELVIQRVDLWGTKGKMRNFFKEPIASEEEMLKIENKLAKSTKRVLNFKIRQ
jgi:hypothetical protein